MAVILNTNGQVVVTPAPPLPNSAPTTPEPDVQPTIAPAMPGKQYGGPFTHQGPGGQFWEAW